MPIGRTDTITGGAAADSLTGGASADRFVQAAAASFNANAAIAASATVYTFDLSLGIDVVTGFSAVQGDVVQLTGFAGAITDSSADGNGAITNTNATIFRGTYTAGTNTFVAGDGTGNDLLVFVAGATAAAAAGFAAVGIGNQGAVLLGAGGQTLGAAQIIA